MTTRLSNRAHNGVALRFNSGVSDDDDGDRVVGGRVVAVTGVGQDLREARRIAYARMGAIEFAGMQVRRDIAWRAPGASLASYADAGVDINEGTRAVAEMKAAVESTHDVGSGRGGCCMGSAALVVSSRPAAITEHDDPVLVASTDGGRHESGTCCATRPACAGWGADIVNHCIGDVLVQNARPLFFLDYIAASVLDADMVCCHREGHGRGLSCSKLRRAGWRDRRDAGRLPTRGVRHRRNSRGSGGAIGAAPPAGCLRRRRTDRCRLVGPTHQWVLIASARSSSGRRWTSRWRAWTDRWGDALLEPHRNYLDPLRSALESGKVKAACADYRRWSAGESATGAPRRRWRPR